MNKMDLFPIFNGISEDTKITLEKKGKIEKFSRGQVVFRAKEPVTRVFLQMSGKSIVYNLTSGGKRKILFVFGAGSILNENVFPATNRSLYCDTIEKSELFTIPADVFMSCMQKDMVLVKNVLAAQENKIWRLGHQLKNTMGSIYMERKLSAKLWKLQRDFGISTEKGVEIDVDLPLTFLADMLGVPRETASKTTKTLIAAGLISMDKKRITVMDGNALAKVYHTGILPQAIEKK